MKTNFKPNNSSIEASSQCVMVTTETGRGKPFNSHWLVAGRFSLAVEGERGIFVERSRMWQVR